MLCSKRTSCGRNKQPIHILSYIICVLYAIYIMIMEIKWRRCKFGDGVHGWEKEGGKKGKLIGWES